MKIQINITEEVLEKSKMSGVALPKFCSIESCAIALAVREIFPKALVGPFHIRLSEMVMLPKSASDFIKIFDNSTPEERTQLPPFSFQIDVPHTVIDQIGIAQVYKILSESKTLQHVN